MLQEDYLFRPLYMLIDEITSKFSAIKVERIKQLEAFLDDMYKDYIKGNRNYFIEKDINEILENEELSSKQIELLAALFYRDALLQKDRVLQKLLLSKAKTIYLYISKNSDTYSFDRANRINEIDNLLHSIG